MAYSNAYVYKYNADLTRDISWVDSIGATPREALQSDVNSAWVITAGNVSSGGTGTHSRVNPDDDTDSATLGFGNAPCYSTAFLSNGKFLISVQRTDTTGRIYQKTSDGSSDWEFAHGNHIIRGFSEDSNGLPFFVGDRDTNYSVWSITVGGPSANNIYDTGTDTYGIAWVLQFLPQTSGPDITAVKKLVAAGNNELWYETSAGTMGELTAANGNIDTTDQLAMYEGYQKVFIANGAKLRIADFINTKLSTADVRPDDGANVAPIKGTILTGGTSTAKMVVDFCNAFNGTALIYGYVISGTFQNGEVITGINASGTPTAVSFTTNAAPVSAPHWYDWITYPTIGGKSFGELPNKAYIGCLYRGRCVLSGNPEFPFQWYMSRQTHPWDFAYVANDAGSPVKGGNSDAGEIGDIVRALIPYKDDFLIFGCATSMWFLAGDPTFGGSINELDLTVGIFGSQSWCFSGDGSLYFWGTNGIYVTSIPGVPECITEIKLPNLINDEAADPSTHKITMVYARVRKGILICITKLSDGTNSNYWYDLRTGGFFPESYPDECGVYSSFYYPANSNTYKDLLVGCRDGYIRKFDSSVKDDDKGATDNAINSYVKFGPIPMSQDPDKQGKLSGLNLVTAGDGTNDSNDVNFKVFAENSGVEVLKKLTANTNPKLAGTFKAPGRQHGARRKQKVKGAYLGIRLDNTASTETWGFEKLTGTVTPAGRNR